jgi:hypothetical protein
MGLSWVATGAAKPCGPVKIKKIDNRMDENLVTIKTSRILFYNNSLGFVGRGVWKKE